MSRFYVGLATRVAIAAAVAAGMAGVAHAVEAAIIPSTATVRDGEGNNFDDMFGFALDFDATQGRTGSYAPATTAGQSYEVDNVTVYRSTGASSTGTAYLGVYTSLSGSTLSGFQGVSDNAINLGTLAASAPLAYTFSNITVAPETNAGSGGDIRYFVFQSGTSAITNYLSQAISSPLRRIDGSNGTFSDELSGILAGASATATLRADRSPEYIATISPVPEPAALSLLGLAGLGMIRRHRRA